MRIAGGADLWRLRRERCGEGGRQGAVEDGCGQRVRQRVGRRAPRGRRDVAQPCAHGRAREVREQRAHGLLVCAQPLGPRARLRAPACGPAARSRSRVVA